jgi:hypothetical protein
MDEVTHEGRTPMSRIARGTIVFEYLVDDDIDSNLEDYYTGEMCEDLSGMMYSDVRPAIEMSILTVEENNFKNYANGREYETIINGDVIEWGV